MSQQELSKVETGFTTLKMLAAAQVEATTPQLLVLFAIMLHAPLSIGEISRITNLNQPLVSKAVLKFVDLLVVGVGEEDARKRIVSLSRRGCIVLELLEGVGASIRDATAIRRTSPNPIPNP